MAASFFEVFPVLKLNKGMADVLEAVSYTHLDVYKRQASSYLQRLTAGLCGAFLSS